MAFKIDLGFVKFSSEPLGKILDPPLVKFSSEPLANVLGLNKPVKLTVTGGDVVKVGLAAGAMTALNVATGGAITKAVTNAGASTVAAATGKAGAAAAPGTVVSTAVASTTSSSAGSIARSFTGGLVSAFRSMNNAIAQPSLASEQRLSSSAGADFRFGRLAADVAPPDAAPYNVHATSVSPLMPTPAGPIPANTYASKAKLEAPVEPGWSPYVLVGGAVLALYLITRRT